MKHGIRPFAEKGYYTEVHNLVLDYIMPRVSASAFKVLLLILRRTKGWGKRSDRIAYGQICDGTGIRSDTTVSKALDELLAMGLIVSKSGMAKRTTSQYALNPKYTVPITAIEDQDDKDTTPENGVAEGENTTPENQNDVAKFTTPENEAADDPTTPKNGVVSPENSTTTPENGVVTTPENGVVVDLSTTPENGDTKENKTICTNKPKSVGTVQTPREDESENSNDTTPVQTNQEILDAVLVATDKQLDWQMGRITPNEKLTIYNVVGLVKELGGDAFAVEEYRSRELPAFLRKAPEVVDSPSPRQMLENYRRVKAHAAKTPRTSEDRKAREAAEDAAAYQRYLARQNQNGANGIHANEDQEEVNPDGATAISRG